MDGVKRAGARPARRAAVPLWSALAGLALVLGACGGDGDDTSTTVPSPPDAPLRVVVAPPETAPGERVAARVVNDGEKPFTYGLDYVLERREGESFVKVDEPGIVRSIGLVAPPGNAGPPVLVRIPKGAKPGEYRIVIQRDVPDVGVLSGDLTVTADR